MLESQQVEERGKDRENTCALTLLTLPTRPPTRLCAHNKNGQSVAIKIQLIEAKLLFQWAESK